ncbi:MAG: hypothetical protein F6K10_16760 [Moorea sp. SIO2B7]|nr:hypothetical protein [Moorena sp. SIO2B7]
MEESRINSTLLAITEGEKAIIPTIRICTEMGDNNEAIIHIYDNVSGMPPEVKAKIFEAFFTTKPVGKGTGLRLSISNQIIVEKHGGQFECISEPGQGTEFIIRIPIQQ